MAGLRSCVRDALIEQLPDPELKTVFRKRISFPRNNRGVRGDKPRMRRHTKPKGLGSLHSLGGKPRLNFPGLQRAAVHHDFVELALHPEELVIIPVGPEGQESFGRIGDVPVLIGRGGFEFSVHVQLHGLTVIRADEMIPLPLLKGGGRRQVGERTGRRHCESKMRFVVAEQPTFLKIGVVLEAAGNPASGQACVQRYPGFDRNLASRKIVKFDIRDVHAILDPIEIQGAKWIFREANRSVNRTMKVIRPVNHLGPLDVFGIERPPRERLSSDMAHRGYEQQEAQPLSPSPCQALPNTFRWRIQNLHRRKDQAVSPKPQAQTQPQARGPVGDCGLNACARLWYWQQP